MTDAPKKRTRLPTISPTVVRMFGECTRKGAFREVDRVQLPDEDAPWKQQGTDMHFALEHYKLTGEIDLEDPVQRVAYAAVDYWPEGIEWLPEQWIEVERGDFAYRGKSDQLGVCFVGDYKFTGDRKNLPDDRPQWVKALWPRGKTPDAELIDTARTALLKDPQWLIYGQAAYDLQLLRAIVGVLWESRISGLWTYVIKPPKLEGQPKVLPVAFDAMPDQIEEGLRYWDRFARLAFWIKANYVRANDVPHQADSACGGLGIRCDYAAFCTLEGPEDMPTIEELMEAAQIAPETPKVNPPESAKADPTEAPKEAPVVVREQTTAPVEPPRTAGRPKGSKNAPKTPEQTTVNEATDAAPVTAATGSIGKIVSAYEQDTGLDGECLQATVLFPIGTVIPVGGKVVIL